MCARRRPYAAARWDQSGARPWISVWQLSKITRARSFALSIWRRRRRRGYFSRVHRIKPGIKGEGESAGLSMCVVVVECLWIRRVGERESMTIRVQWSEMGGAKDIVWRFVSARLDAFWYIYFFVSFFVCFDGLFLSGLSDSEEERARCKKL